MPKGVHNSYRGKSKYHPTFVTLAYEQCLLGQTDEQIASLLHIDYPRGLYQWKKKNPTFAAAFDRGREQADGKVAKALFKRALGFSVPQTKTTYDAQGNVTQRIKTVVYFPPEPSALAFYLSNRSRATWQTKPSQALDLAAGLEQMILAAVEKRGKREPQTIEHQPVDDSTTEEADAQSVIRADKRQ